MNVRFPGRVGRGAGSAAELFAGRGAALALFALLAFCVSLAAAAAARSAIRRAEGKGQGKIHRSSALAQAVSDFDTPGLSAGPNNPSSAQASGIPGLDAQAAKTFSERFRTEIWPLLTSPGHDCVSCHNAGNLSSLHFLPDSSDSFRMLVEKGYLDPTSPTSLLSRVSPLKPELIMPPSPGQAFTPHETGTLRVFMDDLHSSLRTVSGAPIDERFPIELLAPYRGKPYDGGADNTFLTYYQLRGKIRTVFGDDWQRNGQDLWETYIDLFHGADFHLRFNESAHPTTEYLAGVDLLSKDVSSRSYLTATGPFAGWPSNVPAPLSVTPSLLYRRLITQLYNRTLYRPPGEAELLDSYRLIQSIYKERSAVADGASTVDFTVTATDPSGLSTSRDLAFPVSTEPYAVYEQYVDETREPAATSLDPAASKVNIAVLAGEAKQAAAKPAVVKSPPGPRRGRYNRGSSGLASLPLDQALRLAKNDPGEVLRIDNTDTSGNVSVAGVTLVGPLPSRDTLHIPVTDPSVQIDGAWNQRTDGDVTSYEDGDHNKGASSIA
ncbi:MAG: hypothetical protein LC772_02210, partial [Chloroflexi bacterium]|nr:hypothetical protein [Chloroflexota bacterium]